MSIIDAIKKSVISQFDVSLGTSDVVFSLLVAALLAVLIIIVYRKTFSGIVYSRGTALTILLITLTTAMIIRTINSNLSLSLGMVGALSIVRFRTAIKDSVDTAFLFWAVTAGIMSGAGLYLLSIIGSLGIALIYYIAYSVSVKAKKQYLLSIVCASDLEGVVEEKLAGLKKKDLRSKSVHDNVAEMTYLVDLCPELDSAMEELKHISGVDNINLIAYSNDYGM